MPWYRNTSLWSLLVAGAAVILSQLPPISTWLPSPNLTVYVSDRMEVNNAIGVIGFNINVQLNNTGNTDIQVKRMELVLQDSAGAVSAKPALNYFNPLTATSNPAALSFNTINVPKASNWSYAVFLTDRLELPTRQNFCVCAQSLWAAFSNNRWPLTDLSKYPVYTPRLNQILFSRP